MSISRQHAKIAYNFQKGVWEVTVNGKNGLYINRHMYNAGNPPAVLTSKSILEMGGGAGIQPVSLCFLLPCGTAAEAEERRFERAALAVGGAKRAA